MSGNRSSFVCPAAGPAKITTPTNHSTNTFKDRSDMNFLSAGKTESSKNRYGPQASYSQIPLLPLVSTPGRLCLRRQITPTRFSLECGGLTPLFQPKPIHHS